MKRLRLTGFLLLFVLPLACDNLTSATLPEPYHAQLATLRDRNIEIRKQYVELQRQMNLLQTEQQFNGQKAEVISTDALNKLGYKQGDYKVNLDLLRVEKVSK